MAGTYPDSGYRRPKPGGFQTRPAASGGDTLSGSAGQAYLAGFAVGDFIINKPGATVPFDFRDLMRPLERPARPRQPPRAPAWPNRTFARPRPPPMPYDGWLPFIKEYLTPKAALKVFPGLRAISALVGLVTLPGGLELVSDGSGKPRLAGLWELKCDNGQRPLNAYRGRWGTSSSLADAIAAGLSCGLPLQVPAGDWQVGAIYDSTPWPAGAGWVWEELHLGPYNTAHTRFDIAVVYKMISLRPVDPAPLIYGRIAWLSPIPQKMPYALVPYRDRAGYRDLGDMLMTAPRGPAAEPNLAPPGRNTIATGLREPPGPMTLEQKILMNKFIGFMINAVTEGVDFVNALYGAIPSKYRRDIIAYKGGRPIYGGFSRITPQEKVLRLIEHFGKIEWSKAVFNVISNQLEDKYFGKIGSSITKAQRRAFVKGYLNRMNLASGPAL